MQNMFGQENDKWAGQVVTRAVLTNSDPLPHVGHKEGRTPLTHGNQTRIGGAFVAKRLKRAKLAQLNLRRRQVSVGVPGGAVNY